MMKLEDFATELSNLVTKAQSGGISAEDIRDTLQTELDDVEDDEEEEKEED